MAADTSHSRILVLVASVAVAAAMQAPVRPTAPAAAATQRFTLSAEDDALIEDLSKRSFQYFWEQADPSTGLVLDRARTDGSPHDAEHRNVATIAATGFGLTALCIAAERGWIPADDARQRARNTLVFLRDRMPHEHGWFYHFINARTGAREWRSEVSSIDTALLLAGILTARQCFSAGDIPALADQIYRRVDFRWMLAGHPHLLSMGWKPETGFLDSRWDHYCELMILYLFAIGSPTMPIPAEAWRAWSRPEMVFQDYKYVSGPDPLFVHQYSHAWVDFRGWREEPSKIDWWKNSVLATRAHRAFCLSLRDEFPGYTDTIWGITASDSRKGYVAWGGPPRHPAIDGSVVPAAAAGSLMFAPDITVPAVRDMRRRFGDRIYGRYGFADAFHPVDGWVDPDVIGIDLGITLLSAENLRSGSVWRWFMRNPEIPRAMKSAGLVRTPPGRDPY